VLWPSVAGTVCQRRAITNEHQLSPASILDQLARCACGLDRLHHCRRYMLWVLMLHWHVLVVGANGRCRRVSVGRTRHSTRPELPQIGHCTKPGGVRPVTKKGSLVLRDAAAVQPIAGQAVDLGRTAEKTTVRIPRHIPSRLQQVRQSLPVGHLRSNPELRHRAAADRVLHHQKWVIRQSHNSCDVSCRHFERFGAQNQCPFA